jgi:excisionase family DNA binding protein
MSNPIRFEDRITATIDETCAATGIGRSSLYELIGKGEIASIKIGKRRLIDVKSAIKRLTPDTVAA